MRILIPLFSPPTGTWGSLTRVLAIADAAKEVGHEVAFTASGPLSERLENLGWQVFRSPEPSFLGLPGPISRLVARSAHERSPPIRPGRSFGSIWLVLWFTGVSSRRFLRRSVAAQLAAVEEFRPDLLFTEIDPGAFVVSRVARIPIACTYASVLGVGVGSYPWRRLRDAQAGILQRHGLQPVEPQQMMQEKQTLKLVPSIPDLEQDLPESDDLVYVGSLVRSFRTSAESKFEPEAGKRYVFVYVGTGSVKLKTLRDVLPRVFPAESETLCLVGSQGVQHEERLGNVIFRSFWDADGLMPLCEWVLCHGGHNTIIQALMNGVPLLMFPGPIFERRFNAQMVASAGAGYFGELPQFNEASIFEMMLHRGKCAARARELGEKIKALRGAPAAIQAMERATKAVRPKNDDHGHPEF